MSQHAWLDYYGGCWHLVTGEDPVPRRRWKNRRAAIADLTAEGWMLTETNTSQPVLQHDADRHCYCFGLTRTIH